MAALSSSITRSPKKTPGVYFLVRGGVVVYVGKSKKVLNRVRSHMRTAVMDFDDVLALHVPAAEIDGLERALIAIFWPEYNVRVDEYDADWLFSSRAKLGLGQPEYDVLKAAPEFLTEDEAAAALSIDVNGLRRGCFLALIFTLRDRKTGEHLVSRRDLTRLIRDPNWRTGFRR